MKPNVMHGSIMFQIHQNFNLVDRLIFMGTMLTIIFPKIPIFTTLMLIIMIRTMNSQLPVVLDMHLPSNPMSTIFFHIKLFKYKNTMFNLKNMNKIHSTPSLVDYLLTSLHRHPQKPHSMKVCECVPF